MGQYKVTSARLIRWVVGASATVPMLPTRTTLGGLLRGLTSRSGREFDGLVLLGPPLLGG